MNFNPQSEISTCDIKKYIAQLSKQQLAYLQIIPPSWMQIPDHDAYLKQINHLSHLYKEGRVVMAHIVQANRLLFSDDNACSCPAEIVYDISGKATIDELALTAHQLFQLKHTTPDDPELQKYAEHLSNEHTQLFSHVPKVITNKDLVTTTMFIWRPHLPNGVLSYGYFPILISDTHQGVATVLPAQFWQNSELYQNWIACTDVDISTAFFQLATECDIWQNYQDYAKPTAKDFTINTRSHKENIMPASQKSIDFLTQCLAAIHEDYQENVFLPTNTSKTEWLIEKIKSLFGR